MEKFDRVKGNIIVGGIVASAIYFLGGWDMLLQVLITLIILDYVTGMLAGYIQRELSSRVGFIGIAKKLSILIMVVVSTTIDRLTGTDVIRIATCLFFIGNEGISILENCAQSGIPIPQKLLVALQQLKTEGDIDE